MTARPASMREVVSAICPALGRPVPRLRIPMVLLKAVGAISLGMGDPGQLGQRLQRFIHDDVYDARRFEDAFGFSPCDAAGRGYAKRGELAKNPVEPSRFVL